ncbi:helix-turn-helix domain-containing protein, partial [Streptomyces aureus]|uniref:helix-turn-helix domain-containing protein n=1 Tax=Streptomyces aureus TaxID=193461 RepID=UPI0005629425
MSTHQLDVPELHLRLDIKRRADGLTWRQVAAQLDLSASTLSRLADGRRPDADALVTLLVWLDLDDAASFVIKPKDQP